MYRVEALKELMILKRTPEPEEPTPKLEEPTSNPEEVTPEPEDPIDLNQLDAEQKLKVEEFARSLLVCHTPFLISILLPYLVVQSLPKCPILISTPILFETSTDQLL